MPFFGRRKPRTVTSSRHSTRHHFFRTHKDKDRIAGGYKAALSNPHTTRKGRKHAKHELRAMGRGRETHVPFMTKIKRALGIRSTPRHHRSTLRSRY
ncbi:hypothetical protein BDZ94DRAFT_1244594 [Collybia nuda]|uniref:Uncharacterized protein n=1 Tax=Collybia nuda TaxID=64659 RepID=A0A9P6CNZ8_9AGAR|nr:hypothetical protein BDZ94DRAFT_1244594 [Collybia nuda]